MQYIKSIPLSDVGRTVQLAGAVYSDGNKAWVLMLPDQTLGGPPSILNLDIDEWTALLRQSDLVEIEVNVDDGSGKLKRAILRKSERQVSQHIAWTVHRRDGFRCRYCGAEDRPLTVDHLVTWESGGPTTEPNLVSACRPCNNTRGETPFAEWLNDPYYTKVSQGLSVSEKFANQALLATLNRIPVTPLKEKRKRR